MDFDKNEIISIHTAVFGGQFFPPDDIKRFLQLCSLGESKVSEVYPDWTPFVSRIGVEFWTKLIEFHDFKVRMTMYSNIERFDLASGRHYFRKKHVAYFIYSTYNLEAFNDLRDRIPSIITTFHEMQSHPTLVLIGLDMPPKDIDIDIDIGNDAAAVTPPMAAEVARSHGMEHRVFTTAFEGLDDLLKLVARQAGGREREVRHAAIQEQDFQERWSGSRCYQ